MNGIVTYQLGNLRYKEDYEVKGKSWIPKSESVKLSLENLKKDNIVEYSIPLSIRFKRLEVVKIIKNGFKFK